MKTISVVIGYSNLSQKYFLEISPGEPQEFQTSSHEKAMAHRCKVQQEMPNTFWVVYSDCFVSMKHARDYVRDRNRGWSMEAAMSETLGGPEYHVTEKNEVWLGFTKMYEAPDFETAIRVQGMFRLYRVSNDLTFEKLPEKFRKEVLRGVKPVFPIFDRVCPTCPHGKGFHCPVCWPKRSK